VPTAPAYETAIFVEEDDERCMLTDNACEQASQPLCGVDEASPMERADDEDTGGAIGDLLCGEGMDYEPSWLGRGAATCAGLCLYRFVDALPELPTDAQYEALYRQHVTDAL